MPWTLNLAQPTLALSEGHCWPRCDDFCSEVSLQQRHFCKDISILHSLRHNSQSCCRFPLNSWKSNSALDQQKDIWGACTQWCTGLIFFFSTLFLLIYHHRQTDKLALSPWIKRQVFCIRDRLTLSDWPSPSPKCHSAALLSDYEAHHHWLVNSAKCIINLNQGPNMRSRALGNKGQAGPGWLSLASGQATFLKGQWWLKWG